MLDIGCGVGLVHPLIVGSVGELHGFDVSEDSIAVARRDNPGVSYRSSEPGPLPLTKITVSTAPTRYASCKQDLNWSQ